MGAAENQFRWQQEQMRLANTPKPPPEDNRAEREAAEQRIAAIQLGGTRPVVQRLEDDSKSPLTGNRINTLSNDGQKLQDRISEKLGVTSLWTNAHGQNRNGY